jgi:hypothetical protein
MAIVDMTTATSILRIALPPPLEVQVRTLQRSMPEINQAIALNAGGGDPMEYDGGERLVCREILRRNGCSFAY